MPYKRNGIRVVSDKKAVDYQMQSALKRELICQHGYTCMTCHNRNMDWRNLSLSHIIALSRGGKTCRENCIIECYPCHAKYEKKPENRPQWQKDLYGIV